MLATALQVDALVHVFGLLQSNMHLYVATCA